MKSSTVELREKVLAAVEHGGTCASAARRLEISGRTVRDCRSPAPGRAVGSVGRREAYRIADHPTITIAEWDIHAQRGLSSVGGSDSFVRGISMPCHARSSI